MTNEIEIIQQINSVELVTNPNSVVLSNVGIQGPQGPQGPQGEPGISAGFIRIEVPLASTSWVLNHNLGFYPSVTAEDYGSNLLEGDVQYNSASVVTLIFNTSVSGYAYLS